MGIKPSKIACGKDHVLLLTTGQDLYAWGSNEQGQLGIRRDLTEKTLDFSSYQAEDQGTAQTETKKKSFADAELEG
jgi:alpha-tubulin suppressor-like RCC1 family protein